MVFTDLDGTLLDHYSYDFSAASVALQRLSQLQVPLVLITSKTVAEVLVWQQRLGNQHPFIVENGTALVIPDGYFPQLTAQPSGIPGYTVVQNTRSYEEIRQQFTGWRDEFGFVMEGFGDWDTSAVVAHTGLSAGDASLAKQRLGSEPFLWRDTDARLSEFSALVVKSGSRLVKGGRFCHLLGQVSKATAMQDLLALYRQHFNFHPELVALGDSDNDLEMLEQADYPVVVRKHTGDHMGFSAEKAIFTEGVGPVGWNEAINRILNTLGDKSV